MKLLSEQNKNGVESHYKLDEIQNKDDSLEKRCWDEKPYELHENVYPVQEDYELENQLHGNDDIHDIHDMHNLEDERGERRETKSMKFMKYVIFIRNVII